MPPGRPRRLRPVTGTIPQAITAITAAPPATAVNASSTPAAGRARNRSICSGSDPGVAVLPSPSFRGAHGANRESRDNENEIARTRFPDVQLHI